MTQQPSKECNPDDVVCQMEVLRHLKGLEEQLGKEKFAERYPLLAGAREQISADVKKQEEVVQEAIDVCGKDEEEEPPPGTIEESEESEPSAEPEAD